LSREEFKTLFEMQFAQVRNYVFFRSGNTELATDIAQETFLKVWEKRNNIPPEKIKGLLFKIANDLFITHYRKEKRSFEFFKYYHLDEQTHSPEEQMAFKQLKENYQKALHGMTEKQRTVFLMSRVDNLKYAEIAVMVGISVKAVEKRMKLALDYLRVNLKTNE
jgi:RNA polymerase sigma-70 factor (ECF subfamily)